MLGSLCFCAKAVGLGSLVTFYMSEWLGGCYNTHQPPIFTAESLSIQGGAYNIRIDNPINLPLPAALKLTDSTRALDACSAQSPRPWLVYHLTH